VVLIPGLPPIEIDLRLRPKVCLLTILVRVHDDL
jgi:hypothetical protein